ncbi:EutP/PduV family microcompartment system protein [Ectobacillus ponti]|uniref:EutP/PduV family microcompartment system protein n=1 Tax=Ectobacillus ponti TaxID=2961894 RepID=A0AA41XBG1_9BACI|nr:EutP/PduV family microcompartment system protein [Ectobacillus ponti]MCP8970400.1 EutP/PduV family microcompartment system protein [Ectobacillus ponti]
MRKPRAMLIGAIGAGKSSLTKALLGKDEMPVKTQTLMYENWIVDTPGEYTENPLYYRSIMATALEVTHVLFLQDATRAGSSFPPGFASGIPKLPIGVVTKADAAEANTEQAVALLQRAMTRGSIVISSARTGQGLQEIRDLVACASMAAMQQYCSSKGLIFLNSF